MRADRMDAPVPVGAITKKQEIVDMIEVAKRADTEVVIHTVNQGGRLSSFVFLPETELVVPSEERFMEISPLLCRYGYDSGKIAEYRMNSGMFLGSYNIETEGYNVHYAFADMEKARAYSEELKADETYQQSVRDWHAECNRFEEMLDDNYDDDYFEDDYE